MLRIPWAAVVKSLESFSLGSGFDGAHDAMHYLMRPIKRPGPKQWARALACGCLRRSVCYLKSFWCRFFQKAAVPARSQRMDFIIKSTVKIKEEEQRYD